jgi:O-antigen/teichoic acid export membrane protein
VFALLCNVALNIPAISAYGILGAAAVTGGVEAMRSLLLWRAARQRLGVDGSAWSAIGQRDATSS